MGFFDINFNIKVVEWLSPDKRDPLSVSFVQSLVSQVQFLRDKVLGFYRTGSPFPLWVAGSYSKGAKVVWRRKVYISNVNGNTNTPPNEGWDLYLESLVGADERVMFNGQKLVLEYALNKYYSTTFRQPNLVSDIFIDNLPPIPRGFVVGQTIGSTVAKTDIAGKSLWNQFTTYALNDLVIFNNRLYLSKSNSNVSLPTDATKWQVTETVNYEFPLGQVFNFNINVPAIVYTSISPNLENDMRSIVDNIIPYSLKYTITPY